MNTFKSFRFLLSVGLLSLLASPVLAQNPGADPFPDQAPAPTYQRLQLRVTEPDHLTNPLMETIAVQAKNLAPLLATVTCAGEVNRVQLHGVPADLPMADIMGHLMNAYEPEKGLVYDFGKGAFIELDETADDRAGAVTVALAKMLPSTLSDTEKRLFETPFADMTESIEAALEESSDLVMYGAMGSYWEITRDEHGRPDQFLRQVAPLVRIVYDAVNTQAIIFAAGSCDLDKDLGLKAPQLENKTGGQ